MKPKPEQQQAFLNLLGEVLLRGNEQGMDAKTMAKRLPVSPETLSRMKGRKNGDFATLDALGRLVGLRLAFVPDNDALETIRKGEFF
jgi:hypothetical protein